MIALPNTFWDAMAALVPLRAGEQLLPALAVRAHPKRWRPLRRGDPFRRSRLSLRYDLLALREELAFAYAYGCARRLARARAVHGECVADLDALFAALAAELDAEERSA